MHAGQLFEPGLERMFIAVSQTVVQVHIPLGLPRQAPKQHAHHRCDADAASHQHGRQLGVRIDAEVPRRGLHLKHITDLHLIVKVSGGHARREVRAIRRRRHALDADPVVVGRRRVRQ